MISNYVLAWGLAFGQPVGEVLPPEDAPRYALKALAKQYEFDDVVSDWEKKYLHIDKYPELAYIGVIGRIVTERRVSYTWRF